MTKKHIEVACAIIKKDNKIFCCKRGSGGECEFLWEFPGGKLERNEKPEEALLREIKEELNSEITIHSLSCVITHEYETFIIKMHAFICSLIKGKLELKEHIDSKWVDKKELKSINFAKADLKVIQEGKLYE